jgi:hypothetical protein
MRNGARGRVLAVVTSLIALAGLIVAAGGLAADIPADNLTTNPSFESGTTGWDPWHATSAAVTAADAPNGASVAQVTRSASNTSYTLEQYYGVNSANSARGGQTYTATAWVKGTASTAGKTAKLRLREWNGATLAGSAEASVTLTTTGYQQLTLTYTAKTTGQAMTLDVLRENVTAAESFYVDAISLTVKQPALIPAANGATNPSFETNVADWDFWHGTGARVVLADAPHGTAAAQVTRAGTNSSYDIERYYDANTADSAQADHTYAINAWVRGTSTTNNKTAKLRIREWNPNGSLAGSAESSVTLESAKFKLVQLSYVAHTTGNALTVDIRRESVTAAESFYADAITMTVADPLPAPNVWDNPSVETDLSEWGGWQATIARVTQPAIPDPPDGIAAVEVTRQSGYSEYALDSWTGNFSAGNHTYNAVAWVKGTPSTDGKTVNLRLREWNGAGQLVGSSSTPVTLAAGQWKQVELTYTANATGNAFGLDVLRQSVTGPESFYADAITMTRTAAAAIPADNLLANPSFEVNTSGWDDWNGDPLTRAYPPTVTDAPDGNSVVKVSQSATSPSPDQYNLDYWSADALLAAYTYTVSAWVKGTASTDGKTVTLRLREYGTGSQVLGSATQPVTLEDDRFKQVELTYQALGGGTALGLDLLRQSVTGPESFYADAITMTELPPDQDPTVTLSGDLKTGAGTVLADGSHDLTVSASGGGVDEIKIWLDDNLEFSDSQACPASPCAMTRTWTLDTTPLSPGEHRVEVFVSDIAGNDHFEEITVTTERPDTTVTSGPGGLTDRTSETFEFASAATGATFRCSLDSGAWSPCTSPVTYGSLANGEHTFQVQSQVSGMDDPTPGQSTWEIDPTAKPSFTDFLRGADEFSDALESIGASNAKQYHLRSATQEETAVICIEILDVPADDCADWKFDKDDAYREAENLFTGHRLPGDNTRSNAFQHAYWVSAMINTNSDHRAQARDLALLYEENDWEDHSPVGREGRFSSRMDVINDWQGWQVATHDRVNSDRGNQEYFCERYRKALKPGSGRAIYMTPDRDPFDWGAPLTAAEPLFLYFRKVNDTNGVNVAVKETKNCNYVS